MSNVQVIECGKVEFIRSKDDTRTFSKEFARSLAVSIKAEGMHNPIIVRPNPGKEGCYLGVAGEHRHYAVDKVLKRETIEAKVILDMDDNDADMARIAENLWRNPLTRAQHTIAIKKWWTYYKGKYPENPGKGEAGGRANKRRAEGAKAGTAIANLADAPPAEAEAMAEPSGSMADFVGMVSGATGQSERSVWRDAAVANTFTEEQIEVFDQMSVPKADMQTIARIKDEGRRGEIINLIASGMEPEKAITEVMGDKAPARKDGKSKADHEARKAAREEKVEDLSDDKWFSIYCGDKAALLADPARYRADALMFRKLSDLRHAFRSKAKGTLKAAKDSGVFGPLYYLFNRFIGVSHPKDWFLCETCAGRGAKDGQKCPRCSGGGYALKTENYI